MLSTKPRARFCGPGCRESYIEDRAAGAVYIATHEVDEEGKLTGRWWSAPTASILFRHCCYCRAEVPGMIPKDAQAALAPLDPAVHLA